MIEVLNFIIDYLKRYLSMLRLRIEQAYYIFKSQDNSCYEAAVKSAKQ
jgi:hypothetical protein